MSTTPIFQASMPVLPTKSRSMGAKLIVVCALAFLMWLPALFVSSLLDDRTKRSEQVIAEIGDHVGGKQTFLGPSLAVPYTVPPQGKDDTVKHGVYLIFPERASATVKSTTEERSRSLFKVPVFTADLNFSAAFDLTGVPAAAEPGAVFDWSRAELVVGVTDARGALSDATLTADSQTAIMRPSAVSSDMEFGDSAHRTRLTLFGTPAAGLARPDAKFSVTSAMRFTGAQRLALLAYGKTTQLSMQGDWPNPGFDGGFLPTKHTITDHGFTAEWSVPFIARGVRALGQSDAITGLAATDLGVSFIEVADPYQSVDRSLKYVLLFLGLVFLSYFVFEVTTGKRVHPAQYLLVGIAQIIFYLLLLSLSERIGFDLAFLAAGSATVLLLSANAQWVFASRAQGLRALGIFSLLYTLIYLLLRLEDNALLIGAFASFLAVSIAMYLTRNLDWYSSLQPKSPSEPPPTRPTS